MKMEKKLGALGVFSIGAGAMISSGIFVLPAIAYQNAGSGILIAYFLAGILMLPALFSKLELVTAIPKAGGTYFYIERILGTPYGTIAGFSNWFSISLKGAFALIGIGIFATLIGPELSVWHIKSIAIGACIFFTLLNLFSVKTSGNVQIVLVGFLILIMSGYIIYGYRYMDFSHFQGMTHFEWDKILSTTGMVFISYGGITKIASVAEEIKDVQKNLVKGMISAFVVVQILYLLTIFVLIGVMPKGELQHSLTPISDSAAIFSGLTGLIIMSIAAMIAYITTANAGILSASREPMAMSRDSILPPFFSKISLKRKTPYWSILFTGLFMILVITVLDIKNLAKVASLFMIFLFAMVNFALIVIRVSKIANYKPSFKAPLFPVLQIIGILAYILLIIEMGAFIILFASLFVLAALAWYFLYVKKRVTRKSALVHTVQKLLTKDLVDDTLELEEELLDILIERNEIIEDRFDKLIRKAVILDLEHSITKEELFSLLSIEVEKKLDIPANEVLNKLQEREEISSTLLYSGIAMPHAIPHIIIAGSHKFDVFIVRNKQGILWNDKNEMVYTVFCLIGTKDERHFHLKSLMAIAQIIQNENFNKEWMKARDVTDLRTILLLANRKREQ